MKDIISHFGDFTEWNTFEDAGLLKEESYVYAQDYETNSYRVTLENYRKIQDYIWQGGFGDDNYAKQYFDELKETYEDNFADEHAIDCGDGTYRFFQWGEDAVAVSVQEMQIIQTSATTYQVVTKAEMITEFGGDDDSTYYEYFTVVIDTIALPDSPFAGMTITRVSVDAE